MPQDPPGQGQVFHISGPQGRACGCGRPAEQGQAPRGTPRVAVGMDTELHPGTLLSPGPQSACDGGKLLTDLCFLIWKMWGVMGPLSLTEKGSEFCVLSWAQGRRPHGSCDHTGVVTTNHGCQEPGRHKGPLTGPSDQARGGSAEHGSCHGHTHLVTNASSRGARALGK